jgi:uncharacterized protein YktB (UPF0637 family)
VLHVCTLLRKKRPKTNSGQKKFDAVSKKKSFRNEPTFQVPLSVQTLLALLLFLHSKAKEKKGKMLLKPFLNISHSLMGKGVRHQEYQVVNAAA